MRVITETTERTIETPTAVMVGLAAPSQGTAELSTWRVRMTRGVEPSGELGQHELERDAQEERQFRAGQRVAGRYRIPLVQRALAVTGFCPSIRTSLSAP